MVPSLILQPLVENSIKHGLSRKVGEGRIAIRSARQNGHTVIEVIDNGIGMVAPAQGAPDGPGIGLRNVNERLRVIYGAGYQVRLTSTQGQGTSVRIEIPEMAIPEPASA